MPLRLLSDGSIEADTVEEMLALRAGVTAEKAAAKSVATQPARVAPRPVQAEIGQGENTHAQSREWTASDVRILMGSGGSLQETVNAAMRLCDGASSAALAEALGTKTNGLGVRMAHIAKKARTLNASLPVPVSLVGEAGDKALSIHPSFAIAFAEAHA